MDFRVVTLFPQFVAATTSFGVCGRAVQRGLIDIDTVDPRQFTSDVHRTVDDRPYGGGPGMVLKVEPVRAAISRAREQSPTGSPVVFLTPQGRRFDQGVARQFAKLAGMVLVAGRYEGFDERLLDAEADDEISLGDFVLSGGEIAAVAVIDAVTRLLPAVLGDEASAEQDSFMEGLLDYPHYTRPETVDCRRVPTVLLEGNHEAIRRWRLKQALGRTYLRRPELLTGRELNTEEQRLLREFLEEQDSEPDRDGPEQHCIN
ncbi:MAG TPA: tRNA (guanosine(37)-N1)-methyltransferase TrmD [Gammaproteobacteria bacterium]|jgi:tRNA (guanine37-N1)-methyltransferase|nr:tRNA (guanosine(37)-N1)-methyltransferase TrmD [Chromatiales bacterium]MCP4924727.1 tRNA (guanosine(37)-N1)-methyltransferase TrmD [Gammaproteobacteria bacterium]MDP7297094.1 tRNA (guanosine(37)-N1)-methyltransferase TrmD [Gammaproteobacteria bacterium]MDP7659978.1 tRNA (guanosine(37)-N1)-methyltransferase TrmD [Gammaproteobacteria bacterium]HJP38514.1 tRNA (guanosine(37)-N1)-methyltransferase TrmD [Gammaproteobacteria bacterium]